MKWAIPGLVFKYLQYSLYLIACLWFNFRSVLYFISCYFSKKCSQVSGISACIFIFFVGTVWSLDVHLHFFAMYPALVAFLVTFLFIFLLTIESDGGSRLLCRILCTDLIS